jgi:oligoribonuclease
MSKKKATLLWVDLEMTGLSPVEDRILEVAAIATDWDFNEIETYTGVVKVSEKLIAERMVGDFWEKNPESYKSLVEQNKDGKPCKEIELELLDFVKRNFGRTIYLAGNSIHQDRKFIEREWPELNKKLHYRMLDVSAWKIYFENAKNFYVTKAENHRALDDIRGSIEELKCYLKKVS